MNPTKSLTKAELITEILDEWEDQGKEFSLHDVVVEMRNKTNDGYSVVLVDADMDAFDGVPWARPVLDYDNDLKREVISGLTGRHFSTTVSPGGYRVYTPQNSVPAPNISVVAPQKIASKTPTKPVVLANVPKPSCSALEQAEEYVERKVSDGETVTVKMVQSALKRGVGYKSIPSKTLRSHLEDNGWTISDGIDRIATIS